TGGGFLFGIVGALFAVPLVAVLNSVVGYIARASGSEDAGEASADHGGRQAEDEPTGDPTAKTVDAAGRGSDATPADRSTAAGAGATAGAGSAADAGSAAGAGAETGGVGAAAGDAGAGATGDRDTGEGRGGPAAPTEVSCEYSGGREVSPAHCRVSKEPESFGRIEYSAQPVKASTASTLTSMVFPLGAS